MSFHLHFYHSSLINEGDSIPYILYYIHKESFSKWNNFEERSETCYYAQYNSYGKGFDEKNVAEWTYILSDDEAKEYTLENIFKDWKPIV